MQRTGYLISSELSGCPGNCVMAPGAAFQQLFSAERPASYCGAQNVALWQVVNALRTLVRIDCAAKMLSPNRILQILDPDGSGTRLTYGKCIELFAGDATKKSRAQESTEDPVLAQMKDEVIAQIEQKIGLRLGDGFLDHDPKKSSVRDPMVSSRLQQVFGFDLSAINLGKVLMELSQPIRDSFAIYEGVYKRMLKDQGAGVLAAERYQIPKMYSDRDANLSGNELQPVADLRQLFADATIAQQQLKKRLVFNDVDVQHVDVSDEFWPCKTYIQGASLQRGQAKLGTKSESANSSSSANTIVSAFDPGIKREARCRQKADYKYRQKYGDGLKFARIRDIARLSLNYKDCKSLLRGIEELPHMFNVVEIDNRFANPTPLGWRDFAALVVEEVADSSATGAHSGNTKSTRKHICEIQLHLLDYVEARKRAHKHYVTLRELLPKLVDAKHCDVLQNLILDALERSGVRSKIWTNPWLTNPSIERLGIDRFPEKRPEKLPQLAGARQGWMFAVPQNAGNLDRGEPKLSAFPAARSGHIADITSSMADCGTGWR